MAKQPVLTAASLRRAQKHLREACPTMRELILRHGKCGIDLDGFEPFQTLVRSIISQQLSAKAADTIGERIEALVPGFTPGRFLRADPDALRGAGLSASKIRYIRELAQRVVKRRIDFEAMRSMPDGAVLALLTEVPGIGRWTAEMFLIFGLKRPNILSLGDAGLQRSVKLLLGDAASLEEAAKSWEPYVSVASWYLWKNLDA